MVKYFLLHLCFCLLFVNVLVSLWNIWKMFSNSWHKVILIKCKIDISYRFWKLIYHSWSQSEVSSLFYVLFWYVVIFSMIWLEVETLVWAIIEASLDWTFFQIMPPLFILEWYICITKDLYWYIANWYDTIPRN